MDARHPGVRGDHVAGVAVEAQPKEDEMKRAIIGLAVLAASLSGCSEDSEEKGELSDAVVGPTVEVNCALEPSRPGVGDSRIDVACERAQ
jgi:hypothetical protein